ncbi:MAG: hypothetical protein NT029_21905, partial [Armatimonadetes bacterium]|nr:hypothetical protein [Armatimonadota bacterium]
MLAGLAMLLLVAQTNLAANPTFRSGVFDPEKWTLNRPAGNRAQWVTDRRNPEVKGLRLEGSGADWAGATGRQMAVKPGSTFTVAAWVRTSGVDPAACNLFVRFFGAAGFLGQEGPAIPAATARWKLISGLVQAPDGAQTADASVQLKSKGTALLGAVGLYEGDVTARLASLLPMPALNEPVPVTEPQGMAPDLNRNGLPDRLERILAIPAGAKSVRRTRKNTTCLQTPVGYTSDNDLKVDTVLVVNESREAISSWQAMGYRTPFM